MYKFTQAWFNNTAKLNWNQILPQINPKVILEIGSFEGASTCYLIEKFCNIHPITIYCIDTWEGGIEHKEMGMDMEAVEERFDYNIKYASNKVLHRPTVIKLKGYSDKKLAELLLEGKENFFDMVYIDGSHASTDVLVDAVLSFKLIKIGGSMVFDDYLWAHGEKNIDYFPKIAIDAFTTIYANKVDISPSFNSQIFVHKRDN